MGYGNRKTTKAPQSLQQVRPRSVVQADEQMEATPSMSRRRRSRGIVTGPQGITGQTRVERKTLLGQ
ncbi:MAG TPA: hypothetical protein DCW74_01850 [Alteromonas australica]|uniref:Uncharacterized protein n=1 Tax=Alteromonas australica TaxID=589873 RepID=A0A350NZJ3_9ALTE|nr:hypothetical protein [Alteromonas australica]|tara:strand:+ start:618 stop:818 length:201 start_codon:yes stop_codon:yes gene_type:complete